MEESRTRLPYRKQFHLRVMHTIESERQWHAHDRMRNVFAAISASLLVCIGTFWVSSHNAPSLLNLPSSQALGLSETGISRSVASSGNGDGHQLLGNLMGDVIQAKPSQTQTLTGWEKEQRALDSIIKKAEKRLKKDVKADDPDEEARKEQGFNQSTSSVIRDDGEDVEKGLPEDSIRAEAAAMGFASVSAWRKANEHHINFHGEKKQEEKKAPPVKHPPNIKKPLAQPLARRPENVIGKLGHWLSSFFKSDGEQQLYGLHSNMINTEDGAWKGGGSEDTGALKMARPALGQVVGSGVSGQEEEHRGELHGWRPEGLEQEEKEQREQREQREGEGAMAWRDFRGLRNDLQPTEIVHSPLSGAFRKSVDEFRKDWDRDRGESAIPFATSFPRPDPGGVQISQQWLRQQSTPDRGQEEEGGGALGVQEEEGKGGGMGLEGEGGRRETGKAEVAESIMSIFKPSPPSLSLIKLSKEEQDRW